MKQSIKSQIKTLPKGPGVYLFKDKNEQIIYIGKAKNIKKRVQSHFSSKNLKDNRPGSTIINYSKVRTIDFISTKSEKDALILESQLIKKHQPYYNLELKDDKNFLYVGFSKEKFPRVFTTRQTKKIDATYIGPFVAGKETKEFLFLLRKIFPYKTCNNSVDNPCLYYHLGQCWAHLEKAEKYQQIVEGLKALIKIYNGIGAHIEGYDISNTSGKTSVGSMVTFINNRPQKSLYRKFKIKNVSGANDPQSLKEIILRRLSHKEWKYPDLIIIDGGRSQLALLKEIPIPVIAIAKKHQKKLSLLTKRSKIDGTIYSPYSSKSIKTSWLPEIVKNTILALRDEAHRFAITYHRLKREKANLEAK